MIIQKIDLSLSENLRLAPVYNKNGLNINVQNEMVMCH